MKKNILYTVAIMAAILLVPELRAQSYNIDWFTIDGGGGSRDYDAQKSKNERTGWIEIGIGAVFLVGGGVWLVAEIRARTSDWQYDVISLGIPATVDAEGPRTEPGNLGPGWVGLWTKTDSVTEFDDLRVVPATPEPAPAPAPAPDPKAPPK